MTNKRFRAMLGAAVIAVLSTQPVRADESQCTAEAEIDWGHVVHGQGDWQPHFMIPIWVYPDCTGNCSGLIRYTFHFQVRDGGEGSGSALKPWSSQDQQSVVLNTENWSTECPGGLSACYLTEVEVTSITCHP